MASRWPSVALHSLVLATQALVSVHRAHATATMTPGAAFAVAVTATETVAIDCFGGFVRVQVDAAPTVTATPCSGVVTIAVTGSGAFANVFNLNAVAPADFPALVATTLDGGGGTDNLFGSQGDDLVRGGDGDDALFGGLGNDTFVWNPGDDNDILEGQGGTDTLSFNGANLSEVVDVDSNGGRMRLFRSVASVALDIHDVEIVDITLFGGSDFVTLHDLAGVSSLSAIRIDGGEGSDVLDASQQVGPAVAVDFAGGPGLDTLTGSPNSDVLEGGGDTDAIAGGGGNDRVVWRSGDGDDTVDGGAGADTFVVEGSASSDGLAIAAAPGGFTLTAGAPVVSVDVAGVETLDLTTHAGADTLSTVPLPGTAQSLHGGDGIDTLSVTAGSAACDASAPGTLTFPGGQAIAYSEFENLALPPGCGPVVSVPTLGGMGFSLLALALGVAGLTLLHRALASSRSGPQRTRPL